MKKNNKNIQIFGEPATWTDKEKVGITEVLLTWINANDHTFDLYEFLREIREKEEFLPRTKYTDKLEMLFHKDLEDEHLLEMYDNIYKKRKKEYEQYLQNKEGEELLSVNVEGGLQ
jgi:hypothetical protein